MAALLANHSSEGSRNNHDEEPAATTSNGPTGNPVGSDGCVPSDNESLFDGSSESEQTDVPPAVRDDVDAPGHGDSNKSILEGSSESETERDLSPTREPSGPRDNENDEGNMSTDLWARGRRANWGVGVTR